MAEPPRTARPFLATPGPGGRGGTTVAVSADAAWLAAISDASPAAIVGIAHTGEVRWANRRARDLLDLPDALCAGGPEEQLAGLIGQRVTDPDAVREQARSFYAGDEERFADQLQWRDGRIFNRYGSVLRDGHGGRVGWAWYLLDVTEQHATERMLRESNAELGRLADTLQRSLLPPHLPRIPGIELGAAYRAARDGLAVGGDYYDVFRTGRGRWGIVVGDVCGKGAEAAALTALTRYSVRAAAEPSTPPSRVLTALNGIIRRESLEERFSTAVFAAVRRISGRVLVTLALGGHPAPIVRRADGRVETVGTPGTALGLLDEIEVHDTAVQLHRGDVLVAYTDGVTEARGHGGEEFGEERLALLLAECDGLRAQQIADRVLETALLWQQGIPRDDSAVVVLRATR